MRVTPDYCNYECSLAAWNRGRDATPPDWSANGGPGTPRYPTVYVAQPLQGSRSAFAGVYAAGTGAARYSGR